MPARYQGFRVQAKGRLPQELQLSRPILARLLAARSGHGDFREYHERFDHEDAVLHCACGADKAPDHFFFCQMGKARARLRAPGRGSDERIRWLLGTAAGARRFHAWCRRTRFYTDICPLPVGPRPARRR